MTEESYSLTTEFIMLGFSDHSDLKTFLFMVLSAFYVVIMVRKLYLLALTLMNHCLHTPMFIFLDNLTLMDACYSCAIVPKMLQNFFSTDKMISLYDQRTQFQFLCLAETTDCFLMAAMAYDCYVALSNLLKYHNLMFKKLCLQIPHSRIPVSHDFHRLTI